MRTVGVVVVATLAMWAARSAAAQSTADEEAIKRPVQQLFDAMRAKDTTALRSVFHPEARLVGTGVRDGQATVRVTPLDGFVAAIGRAQVSLDERIWDWRIQVSDNLATVWVKYDFVAGGEFSHCGVDAFTLVRSDGAWKIIEIADTRRREDCWRAP